MKKASKLSALGAALFAALTLSMAQAWAPEARVHGESLTTRFQPYSRGARA